MNQYNNKTVKFNIQLYHFVVIFYSVLLKVNALIWLGFNETLSSESSISKLLTSHFWYFSLTSSFHLYFLASQSDFF